MSGTFAAIGYRIPPEGRELIKGFYRILTLTSNQYAIVCLLVLDNRVAMHQATTLPADLEEQRIMLERTLRHYELWNNQPLSLWLFNGY